MLISKRMIRGKSDFLLFVSKVLKLFAIIIKLFLIDWPLCHLKILKIGSLKDKSKLAWHFWQFIRNTLPNFIGTRNFFWQFGQLNTRLNSKSFKFMPK
eukprot:COSAG01_NODE_2503_length_7555_cov_3.547881_5_plen_98_part_00